MGREKEKGIGIGQEGRENRKGQIRGEEVREMVGRKEGKGWQWTGEKKRDVMREGM